MTTAPFHERAYDRWLADLYDTWRPPNDTAFSFVRNLIGTFPDMADRPPSDVRLLDCACGTGTEYVRFTQAGYAAWACDGSPQMLQHAIAKSRRSKVTTKRLIRRPMPWNDASGFARCFSEKGLDFDLVLCIGNSLCHMPGAPGGLDAALRNFARLLKPGGRLIVDTKRYAASPSAGRVEMFNELQHVGSTWEPRTTREDGPVPLSGGDEAYFHTSLHYDVDPAFDVCRALMIVTLHGSGVAPRTEVVPYYPLPATKLMALLQASGLATTLHEAGAPPIWPYDCVVAQKPY